MSQEICPFCKNHVNEGADVCHSCGAEKGYDAMGQSKHTIGGIGAFGALLTFFFFSSGEGLLMMIGLFFGFVSFGLLAGWLINLVTPPKWHRSRYGLNRGSRY